MGVPTKQKIRDWEVGSWCTTGPMAYRIVTQDHRNEEFIEIQSHDLGSLVPIDTQCTDQSCVASRLSVSVALSREPEGQMEETVERWCLPLVGRSPLTLWLSGGFAAAGAHFGGPTASCVSTREADTQRDCTICCRPHSTIRKRKNSDQLHTTLGTIFVVFLFLGSVS